MAKPIDNEPEAVELMVWRLEIRDVVNNRYLCHFDFVSKEKAQQQQEIYEASGTGTSLAKVWINKDHLVPWQVSP